MLLKAFHHLETNHVDLIEKMLGKLNISSKEARVSYFLKLKDYINKFIDKPQRTSNDNHLMDIQDELMKSKLDQMTAEINELKKELNMTKDYRLDPLEKCSNLEKNKIKNQFQDLILKEKEFPEDNLILSNQIDKEFTLSDRPNDFIKLRNELTVSNYRCNLLENLLEQKTRQSDQYMNIFKYVYYIMFESLKIILHLSY